MFALNPSIMEKHYQLVMSFTTSPNSGNTFFVILNCGTLICRTKSECEFSIPQFIGKLILSIPTINVLAISLIRMNAHEASDDQVATILTDDGNYTLSANYSLECGRLTKKEPSFLTPSGNNEQPGPLFEALEVCKDSNAGALLGVKNIHDLIVTTVEFLILENTAKSLSAGGFILDYLPEVTGPSILPH